MNTLFIICVAAIVVPATGLAYEKAFEATNPGTIEVKNIPARTMIAAQNPEGYFEENNALFGQLFRYIQANDIAMTVPVKAEMDPGRMYFYVGSKDLAKNLKDTSSVQVVRQPEQRVLSIGIRGAYSEKNFEEAREQLVDQLAVSNEWEKSGDAYAVYWNGPYVPSFMKRFEVHIPVEPKTATKENQKDETSLAAARPI